MTNAENLTGVEVVFSSINERSTLRIIHLHGPVQCQETDCDFTTYRLNLLRQHLVTKHSFKVETEQLNFVDNNGKYIM